MLNSLKVIIAAGTVATNTTAFNSILLTQCFSNCCNLSSNCVTRCSSNPFTM